MKKLSEKAIGDIIKLNLNGELTNFIIVQQGKPDSALYDDSCNGTWLLLQDILIKKAWDTDNYNDYKNSDMPTYLETTFLNMFDENIKKVIKEVKIPYVNGYGNSGSVASGANGFVCKAFLLSGQELGWTRSDNSYFPEDGIKLSYFDSSSSGDSKRIAKYNNSADTWWTRSPITNRSNNVWYVVSGGVQGNGNASSVCGVRPAIILPSDLLVSEDDVILTNEIPTAPSNITVSSVIAGLETTITVSSATDPDGEVVNYIYERSIDKGEQEQIAQINALAYVDTIGLDWGTVSYRVCAVDDEGATGLYITSEIYEVNPGQMVISSSETEDLGEKNISFDFTFSINITGGQVVDPAISCKVFLDKNIILSNNVNKDEQITIPIDTRLLGAKKHTIEIFATKESFLPVSKKHTFTIPPITLPEGGRAELFKNSMGQAIYPLTLGRYVIGNNGLDINTLLDQYQASLVCIESGSYTGMGTYGAENPNNITFSIKPYFVLISNSTAEEANKRFLVYIIGAENIESSHITVQDNTLSWYNESADLQLNLEGNIYNYIAIGFKEI